MKRILPFILLFVSISVAAQQASPGEVHLNQMIMAGNAMIRTFDFRDIAVRGSEMLFENFRPARVTFRNGQSFNVDQLNLDAWKDEIVVKVDTIDKVLKSTLIKEVIVQGPLLDSILLIPVLKKTEKTIGFYQLIGKRETVQCLKKHYKTVREPDYKGGYSQNRDYVEFLNGHKYFVQKGDAAAIEFKSIKSLAALFPDHKTAITNFAKAEKISMRSEDDLKTLFRFINSLNN